MDDNIYERMCLDADELRALIEVCGMSNALTVEFDRVGKEKFDFFLVPSYSRPYYSTQSYDKAEAFILGFSCGRK